jgi:squalene synthase HpnC
MPVDHYENFPVASLLLPRRLQRPVEAIYRFARGADDLADEGSASPSERLAALAAYDAQLLRIASGEGPAAEPAGAMFAELASTIAERSLPIAPFRDLLSAFSQDCVVTRYEDDAELLDYCRRSANPVGRLMLMLYGADSETHRTWSDRICTALQWINFWQDVAVDRDKDRVYLPRVDRERFAVTDAMLFGDPRALVAGEPWKALMRYEVARSRVMMIEGSPLATALSGRIGLELRLIVQGGLRILDKIERVDYDVFFSRPALGRLDAVVMSARAFAMRRGAPADPNGARPHLQSTDDA